MSSGSSSDSELVNNTTESPKWHKNYSRLMPYYYVNHKARFTEHDSDDSDEKIVRVRKVIKSKATLNLEVAEKDNTRKKKQKITNLQNISIPWNDIEEISLNTIKSKKYTFQFIK